jgi:hypothetical protein
VTTGKNRTKYNPRFDFGSNLDPKGKQTGSIKELLEELNEEKFKTATGAHAKKGVSSGSAVNFDSLSGALEFLDEVAGIGKPKLAQDIPLSTLKTIKLLYVTNDINDTQLFRLLKSPLCADRATLEFYTESPARNLKNNYIVGHLLSTLRKEVDPIALRRLDTSFLSYSKLLECIAIENGEILQPIYERHSGNQASITSAFYHLTESVKNYKHNPIKAECSTHEKLYTYLRAIPLMHFIREDQYIADLSHIKEDINAIHDGMTHFCNELQSTQSAPIHYDTPIISVKSFPAFVENNTLGLAKLIKQATGIASEKRDLLKITNASSKVLCAYVFHEWNNIPLDTPNLTVADCVAALCTIRHQQKVKTNYSDYWLAKTQADKETSVLRQMDDSRGPEELFEHDYIPHGINLLLFRRFNHFYMAITGQLNRYLAWKKLEAERFNKYVECYLSNSVYASDDAVIRFLLYCKLAAMQAALLTPAE